MKENRKLSKNHFDEIIKDNLIKSGISETCFTYEIKSRKYTHYYAQSEFDKFVSKMKRDYPEHYAKYKGNQSSKENKGGLGGELEIKKGAYGLMPPKMASVASSSRFCYLALRDGTNSLISNKVINKENVEFEKECRIFDDCLAAPQLDAFIYSEECNIFVEAKCHEIFDNHKAIFKNKYFSTLGSIDKTCQQIALVHNGDTFEIPLDFFGIENKSSTRFDIKQFICHLLGIARQNEGKNSKLVYLFFKPTVDHPEFSNQIDEVFNDLKKEMEKIFNCDFIKNFCKNNHIGIMAIAEESNVMQKLDPSNSVLILDKTEYMNN